MRIWILAAALLVTQSAWAKPENQTLAPYLDKVPWVMSVLDRVRNKPFTDPALHSQPQKKLVETYIGPDGKFNAVLDLRDATVFQTMDTYHKRMAQLWKKVMGSDAPSHIRNLN